MQFYYMVPILMAHIRLFSNYKDEKMLLKKKYEPLKLLIRAKAPH